MPVEDLWHRAEDVVVSVLGSPDDDDHGGAGPALAAQVVRHRDQLVRDRVVTAPDVPVLRRAS